MKSEIITMYVLLFISLLINVLFIFEEIDKKLLINDYQEMKEQVFINLHKMERTQINDSTRTYIMNIRKIINDKSK